MGRRADGAGDGTAREIRNPADRRDLVGTVVEATPEQVDRACVLAKPWQAAPAERARVLRRAAGLMEERCADLLGPIVREAGDLATALFDRRGRMVAQAVTGGMPTGPLFALMLLSWAMLKAPKLCGYAEVLLKPGLAARYGGRLAFLRGAATELGFTTLLDPIVVTNKAL